jgi:drug/metabolite transporter (DMT)-like permease
MLLREEQSEPVSYAFVFQIFVSLLIFLFALYRGFKLPSFVHFIPYLILMSLLYALASLSLFKSFQTTEASEVVVILASRSIWTALAAGIFLGESIGIQRIIGTLLVVLGVMAISWKSGKWRLNKGHLFALTAAVFFGVAFTNDAFLLNHFDVFSYNTLAFFLPALTILSFRPRLISKLKLFLHKGRLTKMLSTSFFYGLSAVTMGLSYQSGGDASQIAPISQSSIVLTVILAFFFLKERGNLLNKILGAFIVFGGVLLLK